MLCPEIHLRNAFRVGSNYRTDFETMSYHYTSPEGLKNIIENSTIRFTDYRFLNDKEEFTSYVNIIRFLIQNGILHNTELKNILLERYSDESNLKKFFIIINQEN